MAHLYVKALLFVPAVTVANMFTVFPYPTSFLSEASVTLGRPLVDSASATAVTDEVAPAAATVTGAVAVVKPDFAKLSV